MKEPIAAVRPGLPEPLAWLADLALADLRPERPAAGREPRGAVETARLHRLLPLYAWWRARRGDDPEAAALHAQFRARDAAQLLLAGEVLDLLAQRGVRAMPLKGVALAESLYADPSLRECEDIDILVDREGLETARTAMAGLGYTRRASVYPEIERYHETWSRGPGKPAAVVELHWDLSPRTDPVSFDMGAWWNEARPAGGRLGSILRPDPAHELAYLSWHALASGTVTLRDLGDVARLARRVADDGTLERAAEFAEASGAGRHFHLALCYARELWPWIAPACPGTGAPVRARPARLARRLTCLRAALGRVERPFWAESCLARALLWPGPFRWRGVLHEALLSLRYARLKAGAPASRWLAPKATAVLLLTRLLLLLPRRSREKALTLLARHSLRSPA